MYASRILIQYLARQLACQISLTVKYSSKVTNQLKIFDSLVQPDMLFTVHYQKQYIHVFLLFEFTKQKKHAICDTGLRTN
jgi:hypothetical protein